MIILWCLVVRWNQCFMGWGGWPLEALDGFWLMCSTRSHIHAWNMAWGWMDEEIFGSAILRSSGTWKSYPKFGFCIINMKLFILVFLWVLYGFICGLYGCDFLVISLVIILVMYMFYDSRCVWISSCFYL